ARSALQEYARDRGAHHRVQRAPLEHVAENRSVRCLLDLHVAGQAWREGEDLRGGIESADEPVDLFGRHAVVVLQQATNPDGRGDGVVGYADPFPDQVLRSFDSAIRVDVDKAMAKQARREDRDADQVAASTPDGVGEAGE